MIYVFPERMKFDAILQKLKISLVLSNEVEGTFEIISLLLISYNSVYLLLPLPILIFFIIYKDCEYFCFISGII